MAVVLLVEEKRNEDNNSVTESECSEAGVKQWVLGKDPSLFGGRQICGESESHRGWKRPPRWRSVVEVGALKLLQPQRRVTSYRRILALPLPPSSSRKRD